MKCSFYDMGNFRGTKANNMKYPFFKCVLVSASHKSFEILFPNKEVGRQSWCTSISPKYSKYLWSPFLARHDNWAHCKTFTTLLPKKFWESAPYCSWTNIWKVGFLSLRTSNRSRKNIGHEMDVLRLIINICTRLCV